MNPTTSNPVQPADAGALLDRYFEGDTTLAEEQALKAYFASNTVAPEHLPLAPLFAALRAESAVQMASQPAVHVHRTAPRWRSALVAAAALALLVSAVWLLVPTEPAPRAPLAQQTPPAAATPAQAPAVAEAPAPAPKAATARKPRRTARTAPQPRPDAETQAAMEEIKNALALVSRKIDKGRKEAVKGLREIERIDKGVDKIKENS